MTVDVTDSLSPPRRGYALDFETIYKIHAAVEKKDADEVVLLLDALHPADIADFLEQIKPQERHNLLLLWADFFDPEVLSELEENLRNDIFSYLPHHVLVKTVHVLDSDDVFDLINFLDTPHKDTMLGILSGSERIAIEKALSYPEDSAGRLMQREVMIIPEHWHVGNVITYMRKHKSMLPSQFYHIILINPKMEPVGQVSLGKLLSSHNDVHLKNIADTNFHAIPVDQTAEDVAYAFNQYHLISAPVVQENGRLVGIITIDDAMNLLDEAHNKDVMMMAGIHKDGGSLLASMPATFMQRAPWLLVNLVTAILASLVIAQFDEAIAQIVALAILMPIIASMGGNAGTQSLTVAVRSLATKDLTSSNVWRVIGREWVLGLANGLLFAVVMGIIAYFWFDIPLLGAVIALAMVLNLSAAALAGVIVPVIMHKLKIDPALASGTFVTTVTDIVGFFAFLGLATVFLL